MIKTLTIDGKQFGLKATTEREKRGANAMASVIKAHPQGKFWQEEGKPEVVIGEIRGVRFDFFYGKGRGIVDGINIYGWHQMQQDLRAVEQNYQDDQFDVIDNG